MLNYNAEQNVLEAFKVPYAPRSYVYKEDDMYESYRKYLEKGMEEDLKRVFIPELNKILNKDLASDTYPVSLKSIRIVEEESRYMSSRMYSVFVRLNGLGNAQVPPEFCIFKIPYMDQFGMLERNGKSYAMIRELVQDDDITLSNNQLKIITRDGYYINVMLDGASLKMKFRKSKLNVYDVLFGLAERDGLDKEKLFSKLVSIRFANVFKDEMDKLRTMRYGRSGALLAITPENLKGQVVKSDSRLDFIRELATPAYSLVNVRDKINNVLSLDRAVGKRLSRDVYNQDGRLLIKQDTVLTAEMLKKVKYHKINELYVYDIPNMMGCFLAEPVHMVVLRRGTRVLDCIRKWVGDYKGAYLDRDIIIKDISDDNTIHANTKIEDGFLEMLAYNGHTQAVVKESTTTEVSTVIPLENSIVGNRHFKAKDLGITAKTEYVYVDENNKVLPPRNIFTAYDLLAMLSLYDKLLNGDDFVAIASADLGLRKKVNQTSESFHRAFLKATRQYLQSHKRKLGDSYKNCKNILNKADELEVMFYHLEKDWWRVLYKDMRVIQFPDRSNPIAFYSSFSKVKTIVKDKQAISDVQHTVSMNHFGKLCPYETPAGKSLGLVNNKAQGCKIENGIMKTSYFEVRHHGDESYIIKDKVCWFTAQEEEQYRRANIASVDVDWKTGRILTKGRVLALVPNKIALEKTTVTYIDTSLIEYVNTDPNQSNSLTAATIPFEGADDTTRVTFELSMCKQAKGLLDPEVPLVITSAFLDAPMVSQYFMVVAEYDGVVEEASAGYIRMYYPEIGDRREYIYRTTEFSNDSLIVRELCVQEGDEVKAGHCLMKSNFIRDNYMATGANCLVGYFVKGSNYEDGVFAAERMSQRFTSFGTKKEEQIISKNFKNPRIVRFSKLTYNAKGGVLCRYKYSSGSEKNVALVRSKKAKGFIVDVDMQYAKSKKQSSKIVNWLLSIDALNEGDKIANRHGNKGVTPAIRKNSEMPQLMNGEFLDICYNPLGLASRMNLGQVLECNASLAAKVLNIYIRSDSFNGMSTEEVGMVLEYAYELANCTDAEVVFRDPRFAEIPKALHEHCRKHLKSIQTWRGAFEKDGTARVFNPKTGRYAETPVLLGYNYVYKLVHESAKKEHARGGYLTEAYVPKLAAPPKGQKAHGGQRDGYMELDATAAYGAVAVIHENLNERGDNPIARNNLTVDALHEGDVYKINPKQAIRRSTEQFVACLESLGLHVNFGGALPNNTPRECQNRNVYKRNILIKNANVGKDAKSQYLDIDEACDRIDLI